MEVERINELRNNGVLDTVKQIQKCLRDHSDFVDFSSGEVIMEEWHAEHLFSFIKNSKDFKDSMKIIHSDSARYNRLFKRVNKYMDMGTCLFVTLTFTDEVLNNTNEETRRKYVRRFLKEYSNCFIANIDYGSKSGREHYHAIILYDDVTFINNWIHGFSNAQIIKDDFKSPERVSRYIIKIANHFVKASSRRCRLIYSVFHSNDGIQPIHDYFKRSDPVSKNKQLCFWDHSPGNYSNFDTDDYM